MSAVHYLFLKQLPFWEFKNLNIKVIVELFLPQYVII